MDNRKFQSASSASPPAVEASPSNGYPTDGNPSTATPATIPGARWFHQIGEELRNVITSAGLTPSDSDLTQLQQAIAAMIASGVANDFKASVRIATTANIASLTGLAAIDGVTPIAGDRILVKDQTTGSQNGIYVAAAGAWSRATDADAGAEFNGGSIVAVEEGTANADTMWMLTNDGAVTIGTTALTFARKDSSNGAIQGAFKNLALSSTGATSAVTVTADALVVKSAAGNYQTLTGVSLASLATGAASGAANSLDTGSWANSTWYNVFVIWNGTTVAGLFSLSATNPTLPSGYSHFARVGAIRTQSATNFNPLGFQQYGRRVQYRVASGTNVTSMLQLASGVAGNPATPTFVAIGVANFIPPTAGIICGSLAMQTLTSDRAVVAPNNSYGIHNSTTNPPPCVVASTANGTEVKPFQIELESTSIYWASSHASGALYASGWEDNL